MQRNAWPLKYNVGALARVGFIRVAIVALIALACSSLFARETIIVWGHGLGPDEKGLQDVIREFERRNPQYHVRVLSMGAGSMNPQKLMTSIVGRVPPDVIHQDRFSISDWASRNAFMPLNELIERDRSTDPLTPTPEQYYDMVWEEAVFEGQSFGIPTGLDNRALYWNRAIFRERADDLRAAGLDPERPPRTWSETLAYAEVLTEFNPDGSLRRAGFIPNYGNSWLYMYAFQNNASFLSEDGRQATLNTPEVREALQFMVDGYQIIGGFENAQRFQSTFQGGEFDPFITGQVAMVINGDWSIANIGRFGQRLDFSTAPAPVPDDRYYQRGRFADETDQFITWSGGFAYAIPTGARNVEGGWKFIKWATSYEARMISARGQAQLEASRGRVFVPRLSPHIQANEDIIAQFSPPDPRIQEALQVNLDLSAFTRIRPATFAAQPLWDEHVRATELACRGNLSVEAALIQGQVRVQRFLDEVFDRELYPVVDLRVPAVIGIVGAAIGCVVLVAGFRRARVGKLGKSEAIWGYILITPWLIGFIGFTLGPILVSLFFSFTQYGVLTEARWVGFQNYSDLVTTDGGSIAQAFMNVIYLGGIGVPLGLVTGLAVALLLNAGVRGMRFYRTAFYLPAIVPVVASVVLWIWILNGDPNRGLLNALWLQTITEWFGTRPPGWLSAEAWAKPSLILMGLWGAGAGMLLWLAGLKGIPNTLYEAAGIDGASPGQQFWSVTLPQLSPIVFFNAVMGFIGVFQEFDRIYVITGGQGAGPNDSLLVPVYHLFINAFNYFKMGYASALAWVIFLIIIAITAFQFVLAPRWVHYEVEK